MGFWIIFAWIALAWALIFGRGKGVLIRKKGDRDSKPEQLSGPGWRRVASSKLYPGKRKVEDPETRDSHPGPEASGESDADHAQRQAQSDNPT